MNNYVKKKLSLSELFQLTHIIVRT